MTNHQPTEKVTFLLACDDDLPTVRSVDELVALVGTDRFRKLFHVGRSAVSNWKRDGLPPHTHYKVHRLASLLRVKLADGLLDEPDLDGVSRAPSPAE